MTQKHGCNHKAVSKEGSEHGACTAFMPRIVIVYSSIHTHGNDSSAEETLDLDPINLARIVDSWQ